MNRETSGLESVFKLAICIYHTIMVSVLWFIGCLPVVTIPAASAAAYNLAPLVYTDSDLPVISAFWMHFRRMIRPGIPATVVLIFFFVSIGLSLQASLDLLPFGFLSLACAATDVLFFILACMLAIAIPACLKEGMKLKKLMKTALSLLIAKYARLLLLAFLLFFCIFLSLECFVVLLILPALYAYFSYCLLGKDG